MPPSDRGMLPAIWSPDAATASSVFVQVPCSEELGARLPESFVNCPLWVDPLKVMVHVVGSATPRVPVLVRTSEHCSSFCVPFRMVT